MKGKAFLFGALLTIILIIPAHADLISVNLSGATTGTYIDGIGADFATAFQGQTYDNFYNLSGLPSNPLTLQSIKTLQVQYWETSNSILPEPGNMGPLSIRLDYLADSIGWRMGYTDGPATSVNIAFFAADGSLVNTVVQSLTQGYQNYSFSGFGSFKGLSIYDNNDPAGLRYQNFSYNSIATPEPFSILLLGIGLVGLAGLKRRD